MIVHELRLIHKTILRVNLKILTAAPSLVPSACANASEREQKHLPQAYLRRTLRRSDFRVIQFSRDDTEDGSIRICEIARDELLFQTLPPSAARMINDSLHFEQELKLRVFIDKRSFQTGKS